MNFILSDTQHHFQSESFPLLYLKTANAVVRFLDSVQAIIYCSSARDLPSPFCGAGDRNSIRYWIYGFSVVISK